ncbi:MAG: toprim domain-containing protein [Candidatus Paceibacterota bacterium]|jgi:DNA primase
MKLADRKALFVQHKADVVNYVKAWFPEYQPNGNVRCPFHDDTNASLHIAEDGRAYCHGCQFKARNFVDLAAAMMQCTYMEARDKLYRDLVNGIPPKLVAQYTRCLSRNFKAQAYLRDVRGIAWDIVQRYQLGYEPATNRITIPIYDSWGECVNIRKRALGESSKFKMINHKGHGDVRLYPEWELANYQSILLVEGEFDALVGWSFGIPTFTWTGGAMAWDKDYNWMFKDKAVWVLYDSDEGGIQGQEQAASILKCVTPHVRVVENRPSPGKDLSEWAKLDPQWVKFLETDVNGWKAERQAKEKDVCPCCGRPMEDE